MRKKWPMPWEGFFAFTGADWALGGDDGGVAEESESQTRPGYKGSPQAGLAAAEAGAVDLAESQTTPGKSGSLLQAAGAAGAGGGAAGGGGRGSGFSPL